MTNDLHSGMLPLSVAQNGNTMTMSSLEIAGVVEKRHDNVKRTIETLGEKGVITLPQIEEVSNPGPGPKMVEVYHVGKRDSFVVVAQLSPKFTARLVDRWQELEAAAAAVPRALTTAEQFLAMAQITVGLERQQKENTQAIAVLTERIDAGMTVLKTRPANAVSITHLRERIGDMFGLSASIINQAMQAPDAPRPAGMVQNNHADAEGSQYAVFWKRDVTRFFERFVKDCQKATPFMSTHPYIEGRFRTPSKSELV